MHLSRVFSHFYEALQQKYLKKLAAQFIPCYIFCKSSTALTDPAPLSAPSEHKRQIQDPESLHKAVVPGL